LKRNCRCQTQNDSRIILRLTLEAVPTVVDASKLEVSEEELKAAILLFYSLLETRGIASPWPC
jgi:hypothetical protein